MYETIILSRYVNQIHECVGDLEVLVSPKSLVNRSWLYALLLPALASKMQDSIQKVIGTWFMCTSLSQDTHVESLTILLEQTFLSWAVQGHLYASSVRGIMPQMECFHGNRFAQFLHNLLKAYSDPSRAQERQKIASTIVRFLQSNIHKLMPYATVYAIRGLTAGLSEGSSPCLQPADLERLIDMSGASGLPEVPRDLLALLVFSVCNSYKHILDDLSPVARSKYDVLVVKMSRIVRGKSSTPVCSQKDRWHDLEELEIDLQATKYKCLQGPGLQDACASLVSILDRKEKLDFRPATIHKIFDAVWVETEIQDYPKAVLLLLPNIYFHPSIIGRCMGNAQLTEFLAKIMGEYQTLTRGRIYVWTPLMLALRSAVFDCPIALQCLPFAELICQVVDSPPTARVEFQLEAAAAGVSVSMGSQYSHLTYGYYYGQHGSLGHAAFFDMISRLSALDQQFSMNMLERLMRPWIDRKGSTIIYNKWKTTEQLQAILILSEQHLTQTTAEEVEEHLNAILGLIESEHLPRYRYLLEWMVARAIFHHSQFADTVMASLAASDHHSNPKYISSLTKIAVMAACLERSDEHYGLQVASRLVSLSASSKVMVRHEAQWTFPLLWAHAETRAWTSITDHAAFQNLMGYIKSLDRYNDPLPERERERLDPVRDHHLANLFGGVYYRLEPPAAPVVSWHDFSELYDSDKSALDTSHLPPPSVPLGPRPETPMPMPESAPSQSTSQPSATLTTPTALQTKGTAYLSALTNNDTTDTETRPTPLLLIGTLVTNPTNLGGLSRCAETFGASGLYMTSPASTLASKDFLSVSVSSHLHLPIHELRQPDLVSFLTVKKTEGYTIVGIEQTDRSFLLGTEEAVLPEKTVLLLGAEKEGIPARVLGECDLLVEIPQRGVTRSLNVQVAAGAVCYEYSRQRGIEDRATGKK